TPEPADENVIFHAAYHPGGSEAHLVYTALPQRHRIYALHCQGRSLSAIARRLRLDRGTVARHLHAVEDLLLAEQTEDLARLRLRAVEAQHAILAAAWDALLTEELTESDASNEQPYPARRAQLLATAARAARTAAQLQGLFTPAALAAALASALQAVTGAPTTSPATASGAPAPSPATASGVGAHGGAPAACPSTEPPAADPADIRGIPASTAPASGAGFPRECNARTCPTNADPAPAQPAAFCGMLGAVAAAAPAAPPTRPTTPPPNAPDAPPAATASGSPPRAGEGLGERSSASPSPHRGAGQ
ncbi:MAG TPA: helix-turn-helix domain-containing protein, partial [Ktedonobacterales bacterium]